MRLTGEPDPEEGVRWEVSIERASVAIGYRPRYLLPETVGEIASRANAHA